MATIAEIWAHALEQHQAGNLVQAEILYRRILGLQPDHAEALQYLGILAHQSGQQQTAEAFLRQALAISPGQPETHYHLGNVLQQFGRPVEAADCYREAIRLRPDFPQAYNNLGVIFGELGRLDDCLACLRAALRLRPEHPKAHMVLGAYLEKQGRLDEACASFQEALRLFPDYAEAHYILGKTLQKLHRLEEAAVCFQQAVRLRPDFPEAHNNLGTVHALQRRFEEAVANYHEALLLRPNYADAHNNLGNVYNMQSRPHDAEAAFRAALEAEPAFAPAHLNLGNFQLLQGRQEEARVCFERALALQPDNPIARFLLARVSGAEQPPRAPPELVAAMFDEYAGTFDHHLVTELRYRGPEQLRTALGEALGTGALDILDLGCGTGLCGMAFQDVARTLTGVDLSFQMLAHARARGIYQNLIHGDILDTLRPAAAYDLILAGDVLIYLGNLEEVFAAVARALRPGGRFAFQVEAQDGENFKLRSTGRFAHSQAYIQALACRSGLIELTCTKIVLRTDRGNDVEGYVFALQKATSPTIDGRGCITLAHGT